MVKMTETQIKKFAGEKLTEFFKLNCDENSQFTIVIREKILKGFKATIYVKTAEKIPENMEIEIILSNKLGEIIKIEGKMDRQEEIPDVENNSIITALREAKIKEI